MSESTTRAYYSTAGSTWWLVPPLPCTLPFLKFLTYTLSHTTQHTCSFIHTTFKTCWFRVFESLHLSTTPTWCLNSCTMRKAMILFLTSQLLTVRSMDSLCQSASIILMSSNNSIAFYPHFPTGLRLMGIGRNQYIDLMNQYRSKVRACVCVCVLCYLCAWADTKMGPPPCSWDWIIGDKHSELSMHQA